MQTYVVFNRDTGEIVQTHMEAEKSRRSREDLLEMIKLSHEGESLDVIEAPDIESDKCYEIDLKSKELVEIEPSEVRGFGGGSTQCVDAIPNLEPEQKFFRQDRQDGTAEKQD